MSSAVVLAQQIVLGDEIYKLLVERASRRTGRTSLSHPLLVQVGLYTCSRQP